MKRKACLPWIFLTAYFLLTALQIPGAGGGFADLVKKEDVRYHPNGSEPVYVGIFAE